jgi:mannose-6-phosphate isomerase-like protein (cupin superfamily)
MSRSVSDAADKPGEMTPAPGADLSDGPDTDAFVVRAASARESQFLSSRFRFLATTVETAGRYSFLHVDVPVGSGPRPHVHPEADEWFYVLDGNPVFHLDDRTFPLAEGDFVHIPMGTTHWFEVLDAPIKVLAGYSPAGEELPFLAGRAPDQETQALADADEMPR